MNRPSIGKQKQTPVWKVMETGRVLYVCELLKEHIAIKGNKESHNTCLILGGLNVSVY